jgi:hypothetical protein
MTPRDATGAQLSPLRAFVVHLAERSDSRRRRFSGRVEHLASGASTHFSSLDGLLAFFASVLEGQSTPPAAPDSPDHERIP